MVSLAPTSPRGGLVQTANIVDARAAAGSAQALRRQAAMVSVAIAKGLPAKSATAAALMLSTTPDIKKALRLVIAELRDVITQDRWPVDFTLTNDDGEQVTVRLTSREEAQTLLQALEAGLQPASDSAKLNLILVRLTKSSPQRASNLFSSVMKQHQVAAAASINNLR